MVAVHAAGPGAEEVQPVELGIGEGVGPAAQEGIEAGGAAVHGAAEVGNRLRDAVERDGVVAERGGEQGGVSRDGGDVGGGGVADAVQLVGVFDDLDGQGFERRGAAVPEQAGEFAGVEDGGRVASEVEPAATKGAGPAVGPAEIRIVAGGAGHLAGGGEARIEEEVFAEGDGRGIENGRGDDTKFGRRHAGLHFDRGPITDGSCVPSPKFIGGEGCCRTPVRGTLSSKRCRLFRRGRDSRG